MSSIFFIKRFQKKQDVAKTYTVKKVKKLEDKKKKDDAPKTLREMLTAMK